MRRKVKIGIVVALAAVMTASVAYAWIASNTLNFSTTLAGYSFRVDVTDTHGTPVSPPYLPTTMYYEDPVVLNTTTTNLANSAYSNVKTNYEIWRDDGGSMTFDQSNPWLTVEVKDISGSPDIFLTTLGGSGYSSFGLINDPTISGNANNALLAYIGPYTAIAHFSANATVTITFHSWAVSATYDAKVWVSVG